MPRVGMEPIRREQIRRAAVQLIADRGFDRTTLREVALAAGVSTGMINHYYPNKIALLVDALIAASEWFQDEMRRAIARTEPGAERLGTLVRVGIFNDSPEAVAGRKIWAWALAESIKSDELLQVIQERRRLFEGIIADVLRQFNTDAAFDEADLWELAAELDAYFNGLATHLATSATNLSAQATTASLVALVSTRLYGASARRMKRPPVDSVARPMNAQLLPVSTRLTRRGRAGK